VAGNIASARGLTIGRIQADDVAEVTRFLTESWAAFRDQRLQLLSSPTFDSPGGWFARSLDGSVVGAIIERPDASADIALGHWVGPPEVTARLYRKAAAAWVGSGELTHRVTLSASASTELLDLDFGHQQAYAVAAVSDIPQRRAAGQVSEVTDAAALSGISPLVSRHQSDSPVFAPRVDTFYEQLPSSIGEFLRSPSTVAFGHASDGGELDGFLLAEFNDGVMEIPLAATAPESRGRGIGSALVAAAARFASDRGVDWVLIDWRTTNPESSSFWPACGFAVVAYRWCRVIDPTPV
jgi:ribosomal protein S18 acetylase RimI-like enzyme